MSNFLDILADLMAPEAQADAYLWASVMLSHSYIGIALWVIAFRIGLRPRSAVTVVALGYAMFECVQCLISGVFLPWDSALDWSAVCLGAVTANGIHDRSRGLSMSAILASLLVVIAGLWVR